MLAIVLARERTTVKRVESGLWVVIPRMETHLDLGIWFKNAVSLWKLVHCPSPNDSEGDDKTQCLQSRH